MTRAPRGDFRDCLAGLDAAELTAFVEAVYDARGWEATRVDDDLLVTPPGSDASRRLTVRRDDGDVTVSVRTDDDATSLGPADLRRMLLYAVDDEARTRLCRTFFDHDPEVVTTRTPSATPTDERAASSESSEGSRADDSDGDGDSYGGSDGDGDGDGDDDGRQSGRSAVAAESEPAAGDAGPEPASATGRDGAAGTGSGTAADADAGVAWSTTRVLAAGLAVVLVVGGLAAAVGPGLTSSPGATDGADSMPDDAGAATTERPDETSNVMDREGRPIAPGVIKVATVPEPKPPGVGTTGVTNVSALTDAHVATLSNRSYRLTTTHREFVEGAPAGFVQERSVVANTTRYRTDLQWVGIVQGETRAIRNTSVYADGTARHVRGGDENRVAVVTDLRPGRDRVASRTGAYVRELVAGSGTDIAGAFEHDGEVRFWITVDRDGGATASILVDENGLIRELHHEYTYRPADGPPIRVVVTMHVSPGNVSVSAPDWADASR